MKGEPIEGTAEGLLEVGRAIVSELDLDSVLRQVLGTARRLTGARYAALGVIDQEKQELERFVFVGIDDETRRSIGALPRGRGVLGELIRNPQPLRLREVGEHPRSFGFPPGHPPMSTFLGVPLMIRGKPYGNLYLTEKEGGAEFDDSDERSVLLLADWASIAIDNARLYHSERERRLELERAVSGLEATTAIARALGGETELDPVLDLIVKRGRALVEARWAAIMILDGDELEVRASAGDLAREPMGRRLAVADTLAGHALSVMRPQRIDDLRLHITGGRGGLASDLEAQTIMYVPLEFRGRGVGVLLTADRLTGSGQFSDEDERLMLGFAASAATAVATAQSVESRRLRQSIESAEKERRRWARELHDETLQELGALKVMLDIALSAQELDALKTAVRRVGGEIEHAIDGLHGLITELRPAALDELGLPPALDALVRRTGAISGLDVDLLDELRERDSRLTGELESTIYRLVQEALNNVVKHAGASRVEIRVAERGDRIHVSVRDDGRGFAPDPENGGFGLIGMRERVALLHGTIAVEAEPGRGTTIRATLPVGADGRSPKEAGIGPAA